MDSETTKINIIKRCLQGRDKSEVENLASSEKMVETLTLKYGGMSEIGPKEIASLYRMIPSAPGDYQRIIDNLVKVEFTFSFLQENGQSFRLENQVCMKILQQALGQAYGSK